MSAMECTPKRARKANSDPTTGCAPTQARRRRRGHPLAGEADGSKGSSAAAPSPERKAPALVAPIEEEDCEAGIPAWPKRRRVYTLFFFRGHDVGGIVNVF